MRKPLTFLALLLAAALAGAGTYSITTSTTQDNRLEKDRNRQNKASCQAAGLPNNCTQSQCRVTNPNCNIYADVADLIDRRIIKNYTDALKNADTADDQQQFCSWWATATVAQRNSVCATSGLPNGCELCQ